MKSKSENDKNVDKGKNPKHPSRVTTNPKADLVLENVKNKKS